MKATESELLDLIAKEAIIDREKLTREATLEDLGISSLDVISMLFELEEKYGKGSVAIIHGSLKLERREDAEQEPEALWAPSAREGALTAPTTPNHPGVTRRRGRPGRA